jgi:hypothetical protein
MRFESTQMRQGFSLPGDEIDEVAFTDSFVKADLSQIAGERLMSFSDWALCVDRSQVMSAAD